MTSICSESNFAIKASYNKSLLSSSEIKPKNKNISMYNTSIFIGGHQNLKSKRIHLSSNMQYNNHMRREIQNFRNKKTKSVDKVNIYLNKSENGEQRIEQIDIIKMMNVRWQNNLQETRSNLSYINNKEKEQEKKINLIDINKYIQNLIDKININYDFNEINNSTINNTKEYFVLLKSDNYNQKNNIIHEIIVPKNIEDLEKSVKKFMKRSCSNINKDNNTDSSSSIDLNKKKALLNKNGNSNLNQINSNKENINNNCQYNENEFCPVFILSQKDIRNLYEIIEPQKTNRNKNINYTINNFSFNYESVIDKNIKLRSQNNHNILKKELEEKEKKEEKEEKEENEEKEDNEEIEKKEKDENEEKEEKEEKQNNWILEQINVEKFEIIDINNNTKENLNEKNNFISVNENQNQNINNNQINWEENNQIKSEINYQIIQERKIIINESKLPSEDFSQCTPISMLQDKFSVYAVSKWIKFSIPHPQSELFFKNNSISKINSSDPMNLLITNFTLWIERIETKRNDNNKCSISINSSANSKNNSNKRGKSLTYNKSRHTNVKIHKANNYEMGVNGSFIKPINLKSKVFK